MGDAEALCLDAIALDRRYPPTLKLHAMIAAATGRRPLAIELLRGVISRDPHSVDARIELAAVLRGEQQLPEAIAVGLEAVRLAPRNAGAHNHLGVSYLGLRRPADAAASFERAIALRPELAMLHYHLGHARQLEGRDDEAAAALRSAIALAPDFAEAHVRLGQLGLLAGSRDHAEQCFARALALLPPSVEGRTKLARVFLEIGCAEAAERCARAAIELELDDDEAILLLAEILQQLGRFDEAVACFGRTIALRPARAEAYLGIAMSKRVGETDAPMLGRARSLLGEPSLAGRDRSLLHYALGKAADDGEDYPGAMQHFDEANRIAAAELRRSGRAIDRTGHAANVDRLIGTFDSGFLARRAALASRSELPVLIVGMIRSGTTLVEQIVSSHPAVGAGGELRFWGDRGARIVDVETGALGEAAARELAESYESLLRSFAPGALRITDKMPTNFLLLGLIHLIFPRARVIHCRRHPVDNMLSMYFTPYTRSPDYAHDRGNLVFYYQQYARLMSYWRSIFARDRLLEVDYEDIVADREGSARRIVDFCGLPWDSACLQPDKNARAVATPSLWQVRQPVYRSSVARWRHYEPWLGEFRRLMPSLPSTA